MKWVWPFNWYFDLQQLKRENEVLRAINRELDGKYRAALIQSTMTAAAYTSALMSAYGSAMRKHSGDDRG